MSVFISTSFFTLFLGAITDILAWSCEPQKYATPGPFYKSLMHYIVKDTQKTHTYD